MSPVARRHHTVPKFYLDRFARGDERIGTVRLPGDSRFVQGTINASTNGNFYSLPNEKGVEPDVFEKGLSELEGLCSAVFAKVIDERVWPLSEEDREGLATFAALQFLRGPNMRQQMSEIYAHGAKLEISLAGREGLRDFAREQLGFDISEAQADQIWAQATSDDGLPMQVGAATHVQQLIEMLPDIIPLFVGRPMTLFRFQRKHLITCDTPVSLMPDPGAPPWMGVGLATAWGMLLPMSRSVGVAMGDPKPVIDHTTLKAVMAGQLDSTLAGTTQAANMFNQATIRNTREWIFHHPDDGSLIGTDLPPARSAEMRISGGNLEEVGRRLRASRRDNPST